MALPGVSDRAEEVVGEGGDDFREAAGEEEEEGNDAAETAERPVGVAVGVVLEYVVDKVVAVEVAPAAAVYVVDISVELLGYTTPSPSLSPYPSV